MTYEPEDKSEARRARALELSAQIAANQQVGRYDGDVIVAVAKGFEAYLSGGAA